MKGAWAAAGHAAHGAHAELAAWVRAHRVSWDVAPRFEMAARERRRAGLDLLLFASPSPRCAGAPGCAECAHVHAGLRRLASSVLPAGTDHRLGPFDGAFHLRRENDWRPELVLEVELPPQQDAHWPEAAERRAVEQAERRLRALGAQRRTWREPRRAA